MISEPKVSNYCVSFLDQLGQRDALSGQGMLPEFNSAEAEQQFLEVVKRSVGAISRMQSLAEQYMNGFNVRTPPPANVTAEQIEMHKKMAESVCQYQRWSDGLVYFTTLETKEVTCPVNAILQMILVSGFLCFIGLVQKEPIRGALDIGWGMEIKKGEIYGAVVANSYTLESHVAQYPRVVVSENVFSYLSEWKEENISEDDVFGIYNRQCARQCLEMLKKDHDGYYFIHYLGDEMMQGMGEKEKRDLYARAHGFIGSQIDKHVECKNSKLSMRYHWLLSYFEEFREKYA